MKPKVVLIATGGTIASRYDPALGRAVASQKAEDLLAMLPGIGAVAELEIDDFATVPSFDASLAFGVELAGRINETLARNDVAGVVVTQGTDTMEETSYLADLLLRGDKPVVFTGAQRTHDDPQPDGPGNILDSIRTAAAPEARGLGAVVCFNGQIHAARDVVKVHSSAVQTFQSYDHGALGQVDGAAVVIHRRPALRQSFAVQELETRVHLARLTLGFDCSLIDALLEAGAAGLVIEAFGRGNGPSCLTERLRRAVAMDIPVVIASRCPVGRTQPIYGGGGGGRDLEDAGAIFAGDLKGPKARLLLAVLLSHPDTRGRIPEIFRALSP